MKLAIVGATGLVGREMMQVLNEQDFPITEFIPVASERSVGKQIEFNGTEYTIVSMQDAIDMAPDIAIFSAGGSTCGCLCPDPSGHWHPDQLADGAVCVGCRDLHLSGAAPPDHGALSRREDHDEPPDAAPVGGAG